VIHLRLCSTEPLRARGEIDGVGFSVRGGANGLSVYFSGPVSLEARSQVLEAYHQEQLARLREALNRRNLSIREK
jgi:hypothetical protein